MPRGILNDSTRCGTILLPPVLQATLAAGGLASCPATGITLFAVGSLRTLITRARWFVSGLEMLLVGSAAAAVAYLAGHWLRGLV